EYAHFRNEYMPPADEIAALRAGARREAEAQREAVQAFFQENFHIILPDHVFTFWAFWLGLTPLERVAMDWRSDFSSDLSISALGISPCGIFEYFSQEGRARIPRSGLDHRLNARFYRDPPAFFTALYGDSDGLHYGLWYDNPLEASACVVSYYSRDGGGIAYQGQTLLEAVRRGIEWAQFHMEYERDKEEQRRCRLGVLLLRDAVMEYETADQPEQGEGYLYNDRRNIGPRIPTCNEFGVVVPSSYEQPAERNIDLVSQAIQEDTPEVKLRVAEALQACEQGQPALALALGHDFHWLSNDRLERKDEAHLLLSKAYEKLGYTALVEIATLHHRYRDLPNVDIYNYPYNFSAEEDTSSQ
ncbi:MAG TPA: ADP-ribosylation family protein, partial [Ktedonobacteraceae bacterium]|nr:ADP-ribosylation family protein [Ktedonobacteraceae bacterium]